MPIALPTKQSDLKVVILGEGPGENEDRDGKPFVGKAGQYLRKYIPIEWQQKSHWANVVRCRPPDNRTPLPQEISCCSTYLERDLSVIKPHVILGLGDVAVKYFWEEQNVSKVRGIPFPVKLKDGTPTWFYPDRKST